MLKIDHNMGFFFEINTYFSTYIRSSQIIASM